MTVTLGIFATILCITLVITYWAAKRTRTASEFYAADSRLTAAQNGFALAGDWCSAAAFLGFDGMMVPSARWECLNLVLFTDRFSPEEMTVEHNEVVDWSEWRRQIGDLRKVAKRLRRRGPAAGT